MRYNNCVRNAHMPACTHNHTSTVCAELSEIVKTLALTFSQVTIRTQSGLLVVPKYIWAVSRSPEFTAAVLIRHIILLHAGEALHTPCVLTSVAYGAMTARLTPAMPGAKPS